LSEYCEGVERTQQAEVKCVELPQERERDYI
jgi:hypothetical protein